MRRGVAIHLERGGILGGQDLQTRILLDRAGEIHHLAIDPRDYGVVREAGTDRSGDVDRACAGGNGLNTAIGQRDLNTHRETSIITRLLEVARWRNKPGAPSEDPVG